MPPKFSLQTVLDIRHSKVEALEIKLGKLLLNLKEARGRMAAQQELQKQLFKDLYQKQLGELDLFAVTSLRMELDQIVHRIVSLEQSIEALKIQIVNQRQEIVVAKQSEEVLDILKEKEIERFKTEQTEQESKAQDDIYISQAFRQRSQGAYHG
jgi:flagellar export protein FliJ